MLALAERTSAPLCLSGNQLIAVVVQDLEEGHRNLLASPTT